jgi:hypothetical protein
MTACHCILELSDYLSIKFVSLKNQNSGYNALHGIIIICSLQPLLRCNREDWYKRLAIWDQKNVLENYSF